MNYIRVTIIKYKNKAAFFILTSIRIGCLKIISDSVYSIPRLHLGHNILGIMLHETSSGYLHHANMSV